MNTVNDKAIGNVFRDGNVSLIWGQKVQAMAYELMGKVDNLRDISDPEAKIMILKALWGTTITDQCNRLVDDTISGLVEVPAAASKQLQLSVDYAPDNHRLEGHFF